MPTMVILVLDNVDRLEDVLTAWWEAGAPGCHHPREQRRGALPGAAGRA